ncbi:hypothetical protein SAMN05444004_11073 [Jannaschia faecimaris]|uniref:HEPN domain-containing protein n=1 Tax=Jannaschia faecimaris TaxID=1244108 RepID=A0A1H3S1V5_9RHOB|nr:hypothetical protein [Jannaschia faecimaris]SDZ31777.1 hypothetical protein SAMN05444004_11073 [Jannaschia faecimaris]
MNLAVDYFEAGKFLKTAIDEETIELDSPAAMEHCFAHSAELAMKSLLLGTVEDFDLKKFGHDLKRLYQRVSELSEAKQAAEYMGQSLSEWIVVVPTDGPVTLNLPSNGEDIQIGDRNGITPENLFDWYGKYHSSDGGWHRYGYQHIEKRTIVWRRTADREPRKTEPFIWALEYWLEGFLRQIEPSIRKANASRIEK